MNNPPQDGRSIDNAASYTASMDVHYSSGVYNKAFYLLATKPGWNTVNAFKVFARANSLYWTPSSTFNSGACGLQTAATDLGFVVADVTAAFTSSASGLTVDFTDTSTDAGGSIASRSWNFGDSTTSTVANPSKTYAAAGTYTVTLTVTDNGGLTATKSAAVTVSSGGGTAERLLNGNFDSITTSGNSGTSWTRSAFTGTSFNTLLAGQTNANTGGSYAYLGVNATTSTQTVDSSATLIPATATATATTATLSFYTSIVTSETSTTTAYDKLQVQLIDNSNGAVLATPVMLSNVNKTTSASTYAQRTYNVAAYKGKTVKVRLLASTDSSLATTFRVDTVSLLSN